MRDESATALSVRRLNAARSGLSVPAVSARRIAVPPEARGSSTAITVKKARRSVNAETERGRDRRDFCARAGRAYSRAQKS